MKLTGIVDAQNFKDKVLDQMERFNNGEAGLMSSMPSSIENVELMEVLRKIKKLLEDL